MWWVKERSFQNVTRIGNMKAMTGALDQMRLLVLERLFIFFAEVDYTTLSEVLTSEFTHVQYVPITATALLIACVLINRSIPMLQPQDILGSVMKEDNRSFNYFPSVPEKFLQRFLSFPSHVGPDYFLNLPTLVVVEMMLTFTALKPAVLSRMNPIVLGTKGPVMRAWTILASALLERVTPVHTCLLLCCPGFTEILQNGDVVWIRLAQSMTVWMASFIQGTDANLCRRLADSVFRMLRNLQKPDNDVMLELETFETERQNFVQYAIECLSMCPHRLSCSLVEFLNNSVIKMFCSASRTHGLHHLYRVDTQPPMNPEQHCAYFNIEPMELETILSLGVLVLGADSVLQCATGYDEILQGAIFTDPHFLLALIQNNPPSQHAYLIQVASVLCFVFLHDIEDNTKENTRWPSLSDDGCVDFYCSVSAVNQIMFKCYTTNNFTR
ncbi:unnamed protein product [Echinostoma caproni]|uniref:Nck-associated protein 1 n=1 Tax=Echinostoma caproni TaxID=27848 RepID=A0A183B2I5_9TREM|nr:unnamed protein product [Echinostoma caproni]